MTTPKTFEQWWKENEQENGHQRSPSCRNAKAAWLASREEAEKEIAELKSSASMRLFEEISRRLDGVLSKAKELKKENNELKAEIERLKGNQCK